MSIHDEPLPGQPLHLERLTGDLEQALAQARKAAEELPPLAELPALQEAMVGLAQMGE
jgi:hypothetical protein